MVATLSGKESEKQYTNITYFAKGGMGDIYKAFDTTNKKNVAIKFIAIEDETSKTLLQREILASEELAGRNIVETLHTGEITISHMKYFYIVQNFYSKGNLRTQIQKNIELPQCIKMMQELLNGLEILHKIIIHRDLKPENILIDNNNELVIADFGLSKFINEKTKSKSFKGSGTIPYMSPECWLFQDNSISMDIYSLGIIFYEILTGELPSNSKNEQEWRDFHIYSIFPDISIYRSDIPTKIKQIILKMTQKRPNDRYRNVQEVMLSLNEAIEQNIQNEHAAERIASIGHETIQKIAQNKLNREQEEFRILEYKKFLNHHVTELFIEVKKIVEIINTKLEESKIVINESPMSQEIYSRKLKLSFCGKTVHFNFYPYDTIDNYETTRKSSYIERIRQSDRFSIYQLNDSIFTKNNIIAIGIVETDFINPQLKEKFGFNLLLVKQNSEIYGNWFLASFTESISRVSSDRKSFALDLEFFLREFELSFSMHTLSVEYRILSEADIYKTIEEIVR